MVMKIQDQDVDCEKKIFFLTRTRLASLGTWIDIAQNGVHTGTPVCDGDVWRIEKGWKSRIGMWILDCRLWKKECFFLTPWPGQDWPGRAPPAKRLPIIFIIPIISRLRRDLNHRDDEDITQDNIVNRFLYPATSQQDHNNWHIFGWLQIVTRITRRNISWAHWASAWAYDK